MVCSKCGKPLLSYVSYCAECGQKILLQMPETDADKAEIMRGYRYTPAKRIVFKVWVGICVLTIIFFMGYGRNLLLNNAKPVLQQATVPIPSVKVPAGLAGTSTPTTPQQMPTAPVLQGTINGDDVILRSDSSISGAELDYLQRGTQVQILQKTVCKDISAAVISVGNKYVSYNGHSIHLPRGQAVEIQSTANGYYRCKLKIGDNWVYGELAVNEVRKIYGDIWYQIRLKSGKIGWVYGDYLMPAKN